MMHKHYQIFLQLLLQLKTTMQDDHSSLEQRTEKCSISMCIFIVTDREIFFFVCVFCQNQQENLYFSIDYHACIDRSISVSVVSTLIIDTTSQHLTILGASMKQLYAMHLRYSLYISI